MDVALWEPDRGYDPAEPYRLMTGADAVRTQLMRTHGSTRSRRAHALCLRLLLQPVLDRVFSAHAGQRLRGVDVSDAVATARRLLRDEGRSAAPP